MHTVLGIFAVVVAITLAVTWWWTMPAEVEKPATAAGSAEVPPTALREPAAGRDTWTLWEIHERWAGRDDQAHRPAARHLTMLEEGLDHTACERAAGTKAHAIRH